MVSRDGSYVSSVGTVEKFEQALDKGDFREALELSTLQEVKEQIELGQWELKDHMH